MIAATILGLALGCTTQEKTVELKTASGQTFSALLSVPEGDGSFPAVVIGPGRGYHMDLPLIKDLAARLQQEGFAIARFNWIFFTNSAAPSEGRKVEQEQMEAAFDYLSQIEKVDSGRIAMVGKSLGSVVAWNAFRNRPNAKALIMLTPIVPDDEAGPRLHPGFDVEERDSVWVVGDTDDENCKLPCLYRFLASAKTKSRVVVLQGDHIFGTNDTENPENMTEAIGQSVYWLQRLLK